ncbi:hypothetical protein SEA_GIANTSBANE_14 [Arthrobacter phage Giantsbane]|nr:hypothetical protein SEA_GIANTSBANE_14 [Arthrobacter phage Giantsbane]
MMEPLDDTLTHYSSANYDPVKAHEYYVKNRELKGRQQSTKGMSDTQKEAWSYTKNKIGGDKKAALTSSRNAQKAKLEALQKQATETRTRIRDKLEALLKSLEVKEVKAKVIEPPKLFEIPENATEHQKALFRAQNQRKMNTYKTQVAQAEDDARKTNEAARKDASAKSKVARESSSAELKKLGTDLKGVVEKARADYDAAKKSTDAKFKAEVDTEYNNIRTKLPSAPEKPKKSKRKRTASSTKS